MRATRRAAVGGGLILQFQSLPAVGADFRVPRVGSAAIKAGGCGGGSGGAARDFNKLFFLIPGEKIEGKKNDQDEKDANGPEKALPEGVPVLLGVKKNPEGHDQRNQVKKDKKETHSGFSQKQPSAFSFQQTSFINKNKLNADS
jgi:hypothetical protein